MLVSEAIDAFIGYQTARRGEGSRTVDGYRSTLVQFLRHTGDKKMASLTERHPEDWFYGPNGLMSPHPINTRWGVARIQPPLSPGTHNLYRTRMTVWVKWCMQRRILTRDIMLNIHPMKNPKKKRNRHGADVLLRLLEVADGPRDRAFLAVALNTGLRASEIVRLRVGDLDLDEGYMDVVIKKTGDIDEQPISSDLDPELRVWLTQYALDLDRPLHADDLLFPARGGGLVARYETAEDGKRYPVRHPYYWRTNVPIRQPEGIVKKSLAKLGLPTEREGVHTIRRSVARAYFDAACQEIGDVAALRETADLLHHSSMATTEIYLGMTTERNRRNKRLRGKPFLSAMVGQPEENVIRLAQ